MALTISVVARARHFGSLRKLATMGGMPCPSTTAEHHRKKAHVLWGGGGSAPNLTNAPEPTVYGWLCPQSAQNVHIIYPVHIRQVFFV
jgi:hypothetical protein